MRGRATIVVLVVASLLAACTSDAAPPDPTGATSVSPAAERPSSTASIAIVSPKQGEVVHGSTTELNVELTGGEIVQQTSTDLQPDQGHLHILVDDHLVTRTASTETQLSDLTPGSHILQVEFVANDHAPFDPRVIAKVTFEVTA
jgi:major membrane immunogen (membrane-anchored lipoprotein)